MAKLSDLLKKITPPQGMLGRVGSARATTPVSVGNDKRVLAHRLDPITLGELDALRLDPAVKMALMLIKLPMIVSARDYIVNCEDTKIRIFVQYALKNHMYHLIKTLLTAIEFGFALDEIVWQNETFVTTDTLGELPSTQKVPFNNYWTFRKFAQLDPRFVHPRVYADSDHFGEFAGIKQYIGQGEPIDEDKLVHYAFDSEFEEVYGSSLLKACLTANDFKKRTLISYTQYLDMYGNPYKIGYFPSGQSPSGVDGSGNPTYIDHQTVMEDILANMKAAESVALPDLRDAASGERRWEIQFVEVPPNIDFLSGMNWADAQAQMAMFTPFLAVGAPGSAGANRSLAETQTDVFYRNLQAIADEICDAISQQAITRLVKYNFGANAPDATVTVKLDKHITDALAQVLISRWSQGQPVTTADGGAVMMDVQKIAMDADFPVTVLSQEDVRALYEPQPGQDQNNQDNQDNQNNQDQQQSQEDQTA